MKKLLLILALCLVASLASATTYYVDNCVNVGSDSYDGTEQTHTTGSTGPWLTIAHVNAQSPNAGDSVLFQKTCAWREALTVPTSGSSGSPITFGSYGIGAQPIINGSDIPSGWVNAGYNIDTVSGFVTAMGGNSVVLGLYDARYGVTTATGVSAWADARGSTGYGPTLVQSVAADQPAYNGTNTITFNGTTDTLSSGASSVFNGDVPLTLVIVAAVPAAAWKSFITLYVDSTHFWEIRNFSGATNIGTWWDNGSYNPSVLSGVSGGSNIRLIYSQMGISGSPDKCSIAVADTAAVSGNAGLPWASGSPTLYMGAEWTGSFGNYSAMTVKAAAVISGNLSATQVQLLEAWAYNQQAAVMVSGNPVTDPSDVWSTTTSAAATQVFNNGVLATKGISALALTEGQWYASGTTLYYAESAGNPGSQAYTLEASTRPHGIYYNGKNFITVNGLHLTKAAMQNVDIGQDSTHTLNGAIFENNLSDYAYYWGIWSWVPTSTAGSNGWGVQILNNEVAYNSVQSNTDSYGSVGWIGVEIAGSNATYPTLVSGNYIHDNPWGMEFDQGTTTITASYNWICANTAMGLNLDNSNYDTIGPSNIICSNGTTLSNWGMRVWSATSATITGTSIIGNTFYGNHLGLQVQNEQTNLTIKNNLFYQNSANSGTSEISLDNGHTYSGLAVDYNLYSRSSGTTYWNYGGTLETFAQWQGLTIGGINPDAHGVNANPLLANAGSGNFTLASGSPAINAGNNLGATYVMALNALSSWPSAVVTVPQSCDNSGWEIGAFAWPKHCVDADMSRLRWPERR